MINEDKGKIFERQLKPRKRSDRKPPELATKDEISALNALAIESLSHPTVKYPDSFEGLEMFRAVVIDYFKYIDEVNKNAEAGKPLLYPDVESLCAFCGISRNTLLKYAYRGGEWSDFINRLKDVIASGKKTLAAKNKLSGLMVIFDLTNNADYLNSSEFHLKANEPTESERAAAALPDIYDKYEKLLPPKCEENEEDEAK